MVASFGMGAACTTTVVQERLDASLLYTLLVLQMMVCGGSTLGFIGIALSAVVETTHPVSSELSGGTVELFVQVRLSTELCHFLCSNSHHLRLQTRQSQVFGALFSEGGVVLGQRAFLFCGAAVWVATSVLLMYYKQEYRKSGGEFGQYMALAKGVDGGGAVDEGEGESVQHKGHMSNDSHP